MSFEIWRLTFLLHYYFKYQFISILYSHSEYIFLGYDKDRCSLFVINVAIRLEIIREKIISFYYFVNCLENWLSCHVSIMLP